MKILSMAWSIYDDRVSEFKNNCTGGGLVIKNICEYIGKNHQSFLFIGCRKMPELQMGNIHIVGTDIYPDTEDNTIDMNEKRLRTMTYAFERTVLRIKPDIVNFHGIGKLMQRCIQVCVRCHIPYVYTDHLFIELNSEIEGYHTNIEWEKEVYSIPDIKVIAVSTGMKKKILKNFPHIPSDDVYVIRNGTDFTISEEDGKLLKQYGTDGGKILLCVGSINERKNQCQIVRAFQLLPADVQNKIKVLFCGKDGMKGKLEREIFMAGLQEQLHYVGALSSEEMKRYYSIADGLIMPSRAEGLSIAALEAIAYGIPVLMFDDVECADDMQDKNVVCFAGERTDISLADAIIKWYGQTWDKDYIRRYSQYFSAERMAYDYVKYYQRRLEGKNYQPETDSGMLHWNQ